MDGRAPAQINYAEAQRREQPVAGDVAVSGMH